MIGSPFYSQSNFWPLTKDGLWELVGWADQRVVLLAFIPFAAALNQAVFQVKIPPDIQGRVFAIRGMISRSMIPLAFILSGPLAVKITLG